MWICGEIRDNEDSEIPNFNINFRFCDFSVKFSLIFFLERFTEELISRFFFGAREFAIFTHNGTRTYSPRLLKKKRKKERKKTRKKENEEQH